MLFNKTLASSNNDAAADAATAAAAVATAAATMAAATTAAATAATAQITTTARTSTPATNSGGVGDGDGSCADACHVWEKKPRCEDPDARADLWEYGDQFQCV